MAAVASSTPRKPAANSLGDLQAGILSQVGKLSSPTPQSLAESDFNAAAANLGSGVPFNSAFGQNRQLVLRDSEQRARLQQAADLLNPSLNRASAEAQAAAERQAAMDRLNISEGGQTTRQGLQLQNALKMQGVEGEQAMLRLLESQKGAERLQRLGSSDDIRKLVLSSYLDPRTMMEPATPYQAARYETEFSPLGNRTSRLISPEQQAQPARVRPLNNNITTLLAQYGVTNPIDLSEYGLN